MFHQVENSSSPIDNWDFCIRYRRVVANTVGWYTYNYMPDGHISTLQVNALSIFELLKSILYSEKTQGNGTHFIQITKVTAPWARSILFLRMRTDLTQVTRSQGKSSTTTLTVTAESGLTQCTPRAGTEWSLASSMPRTNTGMVNIIRHHTPSSQLHWVRCW